MLPSSAPIGNFSLNWAEVALLSLFPSSWANPTLPDPATWNSFKKPWYSNTCLVKLVILDQLSLNGRQPQFFSNERRPQFLFIWRTTSIFFKWKAISFVSSNERQTIFFKLKKTYLKKMEDDLNFFFFKWRTPSIVSSNERWPQFFLELKTTSIALEWKRTSILFSNGRHPHIFSTGRRPAYFSKHNWT